MQKPLTLDEIEALYDDDQDVIGVHVFLETKDSCLCAGVIDYLNIDVDNSSHAKCVCVWNGLGDQYVEDDYGTVWRC